MFQQLPDILVFVSANMFIIIGALGAGRLLFDRAMRSGAETRPARHLLIGATIASTAAGFIILRFSQDASVMLGVSLAMSSILMLLCFRFVVTQRDLEPSE